jgi:O-antigen ligase
MVGHGIGSFYLMSVNYAEPDDPYATKPDFAHNVFLQIAAEEGVPIAALFAGLIAWTLGCGFCTWLRQRAATAKCSADALLILGATLALGAYLQTQMTANSLNVYVSNQFFFWFLMVAILAISEHEREP